MLGKVERNFSKVWKRRGDAAPSSAFAAVGGAFQPREPQPNLNHRGAGDGKGDDENEDEGALLP